MDFSISDWATIYAALLSTGLFIFQVIAVIKNYYRVEVDCSFKENVNEIYIRNLGNTPINLTYWRLYWYDGLLKKNDYFREPYDVGAGRIIEPYRHIQLTFIDEDYFHKKSDKKLKINMWFSGKCTPIIKNIE